MLVGPSGNLVKARLQLVVVLQWPPPSKAVVVLPSTVAAGGRYDDRYIVLIEEDEPFVSHDVVSIFTNTPTPESLDIIRRRLQHDTTLATRTKLMVDDVTGLLVFILTTMHLFPVRMQDLQTEVRHSCGKPSSTCHSQPVHGTYWTGSLSHSTSCVQATYLEKVCR